MEHPAHEVRNFNASRLMLYFFVSAPDYEQAGGFANEQALDFVRAFGWKDVRYEIIERK